MEQRPVLLGSGLLAETAGEQTAAVGRLVVVLASVSVAAAAAAVMKVTAVVMVVGGSLLRGRTRRLGR